MEDNDDKAILNLAAELSCGDQKTIPRLLCGLKEILEQASHDDQRLLQVKRDIWAYKITDIIGVTLRYDFNRVLHGWSTAAKLATIISTICIGYQPPNYKSFTDAYLPKLAEDLLLLARKIQTKFTKTSKVLEDSRSELLQNYKECLDSLNRLFTSHSKLTIYVLQSTSFLQSLINDDAQTVIYVLSMIQTAGRMNKTLFTDIEAKNQHLITDELIYKLSATSDADLASTTTRTLVMIFSSVNITAHRLAMRYKGLRLLLINWVDKGFNSYVHHLLNMISNGLLCQANDKKLYLAASRIQAAWRGRLTRKELKMATTTIAKFQVSYRARKREKERLKVEKQQNKALCIQLKDSRRKAMREMRQKKFNVLQSLPASEVESYLKKENEIAALKIQKLFRGYMSRKRFLSNRKHQVEIKAAISIQRYVRRWLSRIQRRRRDNEAIAYKEPRMDDYRREYLQSIIDDRKKHRCSISTLNSKEREDLNATTQRMLSNYYCSSNNHKKQKEHRKALLAQMKIDSDLILDAPGLLDCTSQMSSKFASFSRPVIASAKIQHQNTLQYSKLSWFRKLELPDHNAKEDNDNDWRIL